MFLYTNSLGAAYMGVLVSAILYGVTGVQTYFYFQNCQQDRWSLIFMVACVWVLDTLQFLFAAHGGYVYLVSSFGNDDAILAPTWSMIANLYVTVLSDAAIRTYFGWRVMRLCGARRKLGKILFFTIMALSLVVYVSITVSTSHAFQFKSWDKLANEESNNVFIGISAAVAGDVLVAASLCSILTSMKSGKKECDSVMNFLFAFFINTGLLTCLNTIACLITFINMRKTFVWMAIFFSLGKLYTNALLASLNARKFLFRDHFEGNSQTDEEQPVSRPLHFKTVASLVDGDE